MHQIPVYRSETTNTSNNIATYETVNQKRFTVFLIYSKFEREETENEEYRRRN